MEADLDVRLLRAFVTVSETGTVSRAADRLARTQAAVSMQLQRLEAEVGAQLLKRSPRGVTLTEAGEILLAYARKTIALGEDARRQIAGRKLDWTYSQENRIGDHRWWISDLSAFERDHPDWSLRYSVQDEWT